MRAFLISTLQPGTGRKWLERARRSGKLGICYSDSMSILKFLGINPNQTKAASSAETDTVRKIVERLDQLPEEQARYIAAFAYLLSRAARADLHVSSEETAVMEHIVMKEGGLPEELALVVVQMAKTQNQL